jgi:hypothetical protein
LEDKRRNLIFEKNRLKEERELFVNLKSGKITYLTANKKANKLYNVKRTELRTFTFADSRLDYIEKRIKECTSLISDLKKELLDTFPKSKTITRELKRTELNERKIIAVFDSSNTRTMKLTENDVNEELFVVETYFYDVVESLILNGFMFEGQKYIFLTASAGQIRTKKCVFIKETVWNKYSNTFMCGLTLDKINAIGGVNINKFLAYLALGNSATDEWFDFDIDKCIVVDDFETEVTGEVDYIDYNTYVIERKTMPVPIPHTDGCGMILPKVSRRNFMVRLPWVKGLLAVFPFDRFVRRKNGNTKIKDIYGKEYDIFEDDIQIIFTKSQFKMWQYYESWDEYKECFKKYNCTAGKCNVEEDEFAPANLNYQMLQTLHDMTDDELKVLCQQSRNTIVNLTSDRNTMLKVFGVTKHNLNKNSFQKCLEMYPELLQDLYTKETLRDIKASLLKGFWSGKLEIDGVYTFIVPDLYAFCEWLFLGIEKPVGLLADGEVCCKLFPKTLKLDCLRSPHLYKEHAVRNNVLDIEKKQWFMTKALYISSHDMISNILMCDFDGDKSLVCADKTLIEVAERNMKDVVPLYYEMKKAKPEIVNNQSICNGIFAAYKSGNIGEISNLITKIWDEDEPDIDLVKLLCMKNNFSIDSAKTLFMPVDPPFVKVKINQYKYKKTPHFFLYAKDKVVNQVVADNDHCVNRIKNFVPNVKFNFNTRQLGKFNYRNLMNNKRTKIDTDSAQKIISKWEQLSRNVFARLTHTSVGDNFDYVYGTIRNEMITCFGEVSYIVDVLVKYLFYSKNTKSKTVFWNTFGDVVLINLQKNIKSGYIMCAECGARVIRTNNRQRYCLECAKEIDKIKSVKRVERYRERHSKTA